MQCECFSVFLMIQFVERNGFQQWGGMVGHHQFMLVCVQFILKISALIEQDRQYV